MKKKIFSIISTLLAAIMCFSLVGCNMGGAGGGDDDTGTGGGPQQESAKKITFTIAKESSTGFKTAIDKLVKEWNEHKYIKDDDVFGFQVKISEVTADGTITMLQNSTNAPDLIEIGDKQSRNAISFGYVDPLDIYTDDEFDGIVIDRYRSGTNAAGKTSPYADNAVLYGIPLQTSPATLFYNETLFKEAGINIINMTEEDACKAGLGAYGYHCYTAEELSKYGTNGLTKTTYNELVVNANGKLDGSVASKEGYRIFNASVPMSIEETFILSSVLTKSYNPNNTKITTTYGLSSEYWFPFGWTVGGDCIAADADGNLKYALNNNNPNYLVTADCEVNGTTYYAGDILSYEDKDWVAKGESSVESDKLHKLSSMSDIFAYFVATTIKKGQQMLWTVDKDGNAVDNEEKINAQSFFENFGEAGLKGFGIGFQNAANTSEYVRAFTSGEAAILYRSYDVSAGFDFEFDYNVAPTPQYKEYWTAEDEALNPDHKAGTIKTVNGTEIKGYRSTMDDNSAIYIPKNAKNKAEAATFLEWLLEDAQQTALVDVKYSVTSRKDLIKETDYINAFAAKYRKGFNYEVVLEAATYATAPDWCYTSDKGEWVNKWSVTLNNEVRAGTRSLYSFYSDRLVGENTLEVVTNNYLEETVREYEVVSHKTFR